VQNEDGGFGQAKGHDSNAQSTAWAVQGIVAARVAPAGFRRGTRTPVAYLASLQQPDGSFRYSRTSTQTPVWVTAQVVAALRRKAFPLDPPARRHRSTAPRPARPASRREAAPAATPAARRGAGARRQVQEEESVPASRVAVRAPVPAPASERADSDDPRGWTIGAAAGGLVLAAAGVLLWRRRA
jgi:hypothetical protein